MSRDEDESTTYNKILRAERLRKTSLETANRIKIREEKIHTLEREVGDLKYEQREDVNNLDYYLIEQHKLQESFKIASVELQKGK